MKIKTMTALLLALILALGALCVSAAAEEEPLDVTTLYKNKDVDDTWDPAAVQVVDLNAADGTVTISEKGDYVLSGTLNGQVVIDVPEGDKVRLILNGVTIVSGLGPAIYEKQADKLIVTLAGGTVNTLTDGPAITDGDDTVAAALYAEDDLSVNGTGTLIANGTQKHGIQSKADLILAGGTVTVTAAADGIRGRNSVLLLDGTVNVTAGGDGITATRTDAEGKGWIVLAGGSVTVKTGDGAGAVKASANSGFGGRGRMDDWGSLSASTDSGVSRKAVKAATALTVLGGTYSFDCEDDGLHGVNVTVSGGTFSIRSGDDAMHADEEMTVTAGVIDATQCYEGLEGRNVTVKGGTVRIVSSDDGINASGGSDGSGFGGWGRGGGAGEADNGGMLVISGGAVSITAGGDGLDSNGSIAVSGGVTGVWTAGSGAEGPIDFNGSGTITGGTVIVTTGGSAGWSVGGRGGAGQNSARLSGAKTLTCTVSGQAGETVTLTGSDGTVLGSFTPEGAFSGLTVFSASTQSSDVSVQLNGRTVTGSTGTDSVSSSTPAAPGAPMDDGAPGAGGREGPGSGSGHGRRGR